VEIAVTETVAFRHVCKEAEQNLFSRFVEKAGAGDVCCQPQLQTAELVSRVRMNARVQSDEYLQALWYEAQILLHPLGERRFAYAVEHDTPTTADLLHAPHRGNG
jgi:hypothetical protein